MASFVTFANVQNRKVLRVRKGYGAYREVRDRYERRGRVDERYEVVERLEVNDCRRDLSFGRIVYVQPLNKSE